ncbi:NmrA family NAD(P)-binding protein [Chitinophaga niabensis]|uniref:Uncharacterized conserved protein YbjT, contains NAD(P)-binding and DUF2867 domains n=1 Tax=Chitinophaga niabensis TaxID=536979 RepID=A0A1N6FQA0_9BACT|nr:NmrA family NAD(P)-binding protein [Chitinophaga niabensis]SIN97486.1 Uncharacterized conserved protein YbjT, contains NAD(P)-binding and DUF2867 domains [Chitinophaga niabensis]
MSNQVLVLGATGFAGKQVVDALTAEGIKVKAATRFPEKFVASAPNVSPVKVVLEDPATFAPALAGVDKVFLAAVPLDADAHLKLNPFIDEAKKAGIQKIVFLSAIGMENLPDSPLRKIEIHLQNAGITYNIVRPNFFMENFSDGSFSGSVKATAQIIIPAEDARLSMIATSDIAAVSAKLLLDDTLKGQELTLTGPASLNAYDTAEIISKTSGKKVTYVPVTADEMTEAVKAHGLSDSEAQYIALLFQGVRAGYMEAVTTAVKDITGKEPISFETFAKANVSSFQ